jgi:hypothetical protein
VWQMSDSRRTIVLLLLPRRDRVQEHVKSYKFKTKVELTFYDYKYTKDVIVYLRKRWTVEGTSERESILPPNTRLYNGGDTVNPFDYVRALRSEGPGNPGQVIPLYYDFLFPDEENFLVSDEIDHIPSHPSVRAIPQVVNGVRITEWKNPKKLRNNPKKSRPKKKLSSTPEHGRKIRERVDGYEADIALPGESPRRILKLISPSPTPPHGSIDIVTKSGVQCSYLTPSEHQHHHEIAQITGQTSDFFAHPGVCVHDVNPVSQIPYFPESNPPSFPSSGSREKVGTTSTAVSSVIPRSRKEDDASTGEMVFRTFGRGIEQSDSIASREEEQRAHIQDGVIEKDTDASLFGFLDSSLPVGDSLLLPGDSRSVFR